MEVCLVDITDDDVSKTIVSVTAHQPKLSQVAICLNIFLTMTVVSIKFSQDHSSDQFRVKTKRLE